MRKFSVILILLLFSCIFTSCSNENTLQPDSNGIYKISFDRGLSQFEMEFLNGKEVEITGFFSISDYNFLTFANKGQILYLMRDPYHFCLYCTDDAAHEFSNTLALYKSDWDESEFTDLPVTVRGIFKYENITDVYGMHYHYMLTDVVVREANDSELTEEARIYKEVVSKGFVRVFNQYMSQIAYLTDFKNLGISTSDLGYIDMSLIEELKIMLNNGGNEDYLDIYEVILEAEELGNELNNYLSAESFKDMELKLSKSLEIYDSYYEWLTRPQL